MTHLAFSIDPTTNDLHLDDTGNLAMVKDSVAVGQHARQRLKTYDGEWYLDVTAGITWLSDILGKVHDSELAESLVKAETLDTDGVTGIEAFSISFDRATRGVNIKQIEITTVYDEVTINV